MTPTTFAVSDFRAGAIAESHRLIAEARRTRPVRHPIDAGISLCLPVEDEGPQLLRRDKLRTILCLIGGFGGIAAGAIIGANKERFPDSWSDGVIYTLAVFSSLTGMFLLFYGGAWGARLSLRSLVWRRLGRLPDRYWCAEIEDSATVNKLKVMPEDIVLVIPDASHKLLQIEGFNCRYIVRGQDVVNLDHPAGPSKRVRVVYRVGVATLSMVLIERNITAEFLAQVGRQSTFRRRLAEALGIATR